MSNDHHRAAGDIATTTAVDTMGVEVARHAEGDTRPEHYYYYYYLLQLAISFLCRAIVMAAVL